MSISPPFWLSRWAYVTYCILFIAALIFWRHKIILREKKNALLQQEKLQATHVQEMNELKIRFFTNVSHELKTPLALIIGPVEKMLAQATNLKERYHFQLIQRNARRLENMVKQLLDFRKLEAGELYLNKTEDDIIQCVKEAFHSFLDVSENRNIMYSFHSEADAISTSFDKDKIERILFNLLSNAFKFTPVGGKIDVFVNSTTLNGQKAVQVTVADNGAGIAKENQGKIFDRFFQAESNAGNGNGLGLSIVKEFINLHDGAIHLVSEINRGSTFSIVLPVNVPGETAMQQALIHTDAMPVEHPAGANGILKEQTVKKEKKKLLLVEDNDDFRCYIKRNLESFYNIIEAPDGKAGWQKTLATHPDIILCDVNMPEMNGIELCRKIKEDKRTSFIPVILVTVLSAEEHQLQGLQTGANDYITKPFNFEVLLLKIKNLLTQEDDFKRTYQRQVQAQPSGISINLSEDDFIHKALAYIEKNIDNPELSVENLSRELLMSRVALYKKFFAITGTTPVEFIRSIRLQRAAQLLQAGQMNVAEVAFAVGFNDPKYFAKLFKRYHNVLPSEYFKTSKKMLD